MKKLLIPSLLMATLASCAGDKGDVDVTRGVKIKKEGINETAACIQLNGDFSIKKMVDGNEVETKFTASTKAEGAATTYTLPGIEQALVADGKERELTINGQKVTGTVTCTDKSVEVMAKTEAGIAEGGHLNSSVKYSLNDKSQLQIVGTHDFSTLSAVYSKAETAPAPLAPVAPVAPEVKPEIKPEVKPDDGIQSDGPTTEANEEVIEETGDDDTDQDVQ